MYLGQIAQNEISNESNCLFYDHVHKTQIMCQIVRNKA